MESALLSAFLSPYIGFSCLSSSSPISPPSPSLTFFRFRNPGGSFLPSVNLKTSWKLFDKNININNKTTTKTKTNCMSNKEYIWEGTNSKKTTLTATTRTTTNNNQKSNLALRNRLGDLHLNIFVNCIFSFVLAPPHNFCSIHGGLYSSIYISYSSEFQMADHFQC